ncbi:hypothetical protein ACOME3_007295 [Neoechinorhynchus agilis]
MKTLQVTLDHGISDDCCSKKTYYAGSAIAGIIELVDTADSAASFDKDKLSQNKDSKGSRFYAHVRIYSIISGTRMLIAKMPKTRVLWETRTIIALEPESDYRSFYLCLRFSCRGKNGESSEYINPTTNVSYFLEVICRQNNGILSLPLHVPKPMNKKRKFQSNLNFKEEIVIAGTKPIDSPVKLKSFLVKSNQTIGNDCALELHCILYDTNIELEDGIRINICTRNRSVPNNNYIIHGVTLGVRENKRIFKHTTKFVPLKVSIHEFEMNDKAFTEALLRIGFPGWFRDITFASKNVQVEFELELSLEMSRKNDANVHTMMYSTPINLHHRRVTKQDSIRRYCDRIFSKA